jgi:hypothetical protein
MISHCNSRIARCSNRNTRIRNNRNCYRIGNRNVKPNLQENVWLLEFLYLQHSSAVFVKRQTSMV